MYDPLTGMEHSRRPAKKDVALTVRLNAEMARRLRAAADRSGKSLSALMRDRLMGDAPAGRKDGYPETRIGE